MKAEERFKARREAAQETRRRLIEVGSRLINERGFRHVSVDDIVKACGVARGTFYIYFQNREALVEAIGRTPFKDLETATESLDGPLEKRLRFFVKGFMAIIKDFGLNITQQWVKNVIDPESVPPGNDTAKLAYDLATVSRILRGAVRRGELEKGMPVTRVSRLIVAQLYGAMTLWCMAGGELDTDKLMDDYCTFQLLPLLAAYQGKENTDAKR